MIDKKKIVAFDLETIADHELLKILPPADVKLGNIKDDEKIKKKIEEAEAKRIEKMGLNPHENMICLFTWCDGKNSGAIPLKEAIGEAEKELLQSAWERLNRYDHFVSFNGNQFDVPVLNLHSLFRGVRPSVNISTKKYTITNHTDLRAVLGNWDTYAPGKLDSYLRRCLGKSKPDDIDGGLVQHYWDCEMIDEIVQYGIKDAEDTFELYMYAREYYPALF